VGLVVLAAVHHVEQLVELVEFGQTVDRLIGPVGKVSGDQIHVFFSGQSLQEEEVLARNLVLDRRRPNRNKVVVPSVLHVHTSHDFSGQAILECLHVCR